MGSFRIGHEIVIDAPPERVWDVLTDFASYPDWNPLVRRLEGDTSIGGTMRARFEPFAGRAMSAKVSMTVFDPPRRLAWRGKTPERLLAGEHTYTLHAEGDATRVVNEEVFAGLLTALVAPIFRRTEAQYRRNNEELKARVEKGG